MDGDAPSKWMARVLTIELATENSVDLASQLTSTAKNTLVIQSVSSVDAARSVLADEHIDCVVCQHEPPSLDGVDVLSSLRKDHPDLPILLATEATATDSAVSSGATDVVQVSSGEINAGIVTKRIQSIVSQARQRGKYKQIFNRATDGIVIHDPATGDILEANDRFYHLLGYERDRPEQLTLGAVVAGEDGYTEESIREPIQNISKDGEETIETLLRTVGGDELWVEVSLKATVIGGDERVLAFVRDITGRKASEQVLRDREQQLEAVFNHPSSFSVVLDENGRVVRANQAALEYVTASGSDIEGAVLWETPWWEQGSSEADRIQNAVEKAANGESERVVSEISANSEQRVIDLRFEPAKAGQNGSQSTHSVAVGYDVTERKKHEERIENHQKKLRQLHKITSNPDLSFEEQVQQILTFGTNQLGLDIGFLSHIEKDSDMFRVVAARGDHELIQTGNESVLSETYCRRTIDKGTENPLAINDGGEELAGDPAYQKYGLGCYLGARITVDGELYGTLCFADDEPRQTPFTTEEQTLIDLMAQWIRRGLEQRQYQQELRETRDRLEDTFERIDDAFFAVDDEWHLTYVNEAGADVLCRATGIDYDAEELLGQHLWEEIPDAVGTSFYEQYHEAMERQESVSFEEYYEPLDVWFEVQAYPDGDGLSVYLTDITERKEREQELKRLQDLLEQTERIADVGGWEIDTDTMAVFWSDHLFELLGVNYDEEPPLDEALDVYLEEDRPIVEKAVDAAIESKEPFDVEVRYQRTADEIRWLRVQGVPIIEDGDVMKILGAAQDITDRKEREQTLNDLLDVTRSFIQANDKTELVDAIVSGANTVFDYQISSVRLHDAETGTLPPTRISSGAKEHIAEFPTYDDRESLFGEVFQSDEIMIVDDLTKAVDHDYGSIDSVAVLPIDEYGVLNIGAVEPEAFDEEEVALVKLLATAAASAFDRLEQESEMRHLKRVIDHVDETVFLLDENGQFTFVTDPLAVTLGTDRDALVGMQLTDIVSAEDVDACQDALEDVFTRDGDRSLTLEVEMVTPNDRRQPVELELAPVGETDNRAEIAGVVTDISELVETRSSLETERERFKKLVENLPDPIVEVEFVDDKPIVQYANPAFTETFAFEGETAHGSNLNEVTVPDDEQESAVEMDARIIDGGQPRVDAQRETADGRRDFLLRGIPYSRDEGNYAFAVYTDITEQKERERYLQVLNRVLRHNLRNDMNVVMALARRLAQEVEDDKLAGYARTLEQNAEDVAALSEKAKEIERVLGRRSSETGVVDITPYLRTVVSEQQDAYPDAEFSLDTPDELWVAGNEDIQQACEELIENAIEHNDTAMPRIEIEARDVSQRDDWVELCFHDTGPGIPDDEWHIVTGEEEISQLSHGSGLGLWLTRWIVESYGGEIYREQRETEDGTTVVLKLRRSCPDKQQTGHHESSPRRSLNR